MFILLQQTNLFQTTQINHGTTLEPNFTAAIQILKFPFQFLMNKNEKVRVEILF